MGKTYVCHHCYWAGTDPTSSPFPNVDGFFCPRCKNYMVAEVPEKPKRDYGASSDGPGEAE